jgi:dolichol-phosphate mannosyltransferase
VPDRQLSPAETPPTSRSTPLLSVVVPVLNEQDNVAPLVAEIRAALGPVCPFEIVYVDDGSTDRTPEVLASLRAQAPELRVIRHSRRAGQSAGLRSGVTAARGRLIATLDGDRQNDPADIPKLLKVWQDADAAGRRRVMVTGHRVNRRDSWAKRRASVFANAVRRALLGDDNPDTGCSLKLYERELFLRLPYFDHMHRYLPALAQREGASVSVVPVNHRARESGRSKYNNLGRALVGIPDLIGVIWLIRRAPRGLDAHEVE